MVYIVGYFIDRLHILVATMLMSVMVLAASISKRCCDVDVCLFPFAANLLKVLLCQLCHLHSPDYYTPDIFLYMKAEVLGLCAVLVPSMMSSVETFLKAHLHAHHMPGGEMVVHGLMSCRILRGNEPVDVCRKFKTDPSRHLFK